MSLHRFSEPLGLGLHIDPAHLTVLSPHYSPTKSSNNLDLPDDLDADLTEAAEVSLPTVGMAGWWQWAKDARRLKSGGVSAGVHAAVLVVLGLWTWSLDRPAEPLELVSGLIENAEPETMPDLLPPIKLETVEATLAAVATRDEVELMVTAVTKEDEVGIPGAGVGLNTPAEAELNRTVAAIGGGGLGGRKAEHRGKMLKQFGGNEQSETAVFKGLKWLAAHQEGDGKWRFNHELGPCGGYCRHAGNHPSTTASTALALLAFLGAGQTHEEGKFQMNVRRGLYHLMNRMQVTPHGGDLQEGTMYGHGMAAMALCEAYAMTRDSELKIYAQSALDFTVHAQHTGGGWRYHPGEAGDTSMLSWHLMAEKSGQMAYLKVPSDSLRLAGYYLDTVQAEDGAVYGYQKPGTGKATTAIGLLCRMYLGWPQERPALAAGVDHLDRWGPAKEDMYYNYYATQVMHHWGGDSWERWNPKMRDYLIKTQAQQGHEHGSWNFTGGSSAPGGRMYNTAMAIMTLEVYYRHLPLYNPISVGDEF